MAHLLSTVLRGNGASIGFGGNTTAANGTFTVKGGGTGLIFFVGTSTAGNASFVIEPGASIAFFGSDLEKPTAGNGIFNIGGFVQFSGGTAGSATFITNPGGYIRFLLNDQSDARFELLDGALLAEFAGGDATVSVGSIEGNGAIGLSAVGAHQKFIAGSNDLSTTFSGTITDLGGSFGSGSLEKIGTGKLTLSGANTYTGGTTVSAGGLVINNTMGSGTGTGPLQINRGILAGSGIIAGAVTMGTGSGTGAFLTPGMGASTATTLTLQSALTFKADSTYTCRLNTKKTKADQLIANGVTIESGAQFAFKVTGDQQLRTGKSATVISNTSANPISGEFANLPDGSTFTIGPNTFQVSYSGGDGNDLTLTVVP
jgi:autotransporter-associated beta strand protein